MDIVIWAIGAMAAYYVVLAMPSARECLKQLRSWSETRSRKRCELQEFYALGSELYEVLEQASGKSQRVDFHLDLRWGPTGEKLERMRKLLPSVLSNAKAFDSALESLKLHSRRWQELVEGEADLERLKRELFLTKEELTTSFRTFSWTSEANAKSAEVYWALHVYAFIETALYRRWDIGDLLGHGLQVPFWPSYENVLVAALEVEWKSGKVEHLRKRVGEV